MAVKTTTTTRDRLMTTTTTRPNPTSHTGPSDPIGPDLTQILRTLKPWEKR